METQKNTKSFLQWFIIFLTAFLFWFILSQNLDFVFNKTNIIQEKDNIVNDVIQEKDNNLKDLIKNSLLLKDLNLDNFWEVYNLINSNYYSRDEIKKEDLQYGAIIWLVNSLKDKHSEFMTPKESKEFNNSLSWDFEWIWAVIEKHDFWVVVDRVIKWSPALENDVLKWDIIIEANLVKLEWMDVNEAVKNIKWPAWTNIILKILRSWESDLLTKEITRQKITIPSVETKDIEEKDIWYISLNMFWENTTKEFNTILESFNNDKYKWIILDLRDNWWWYLQSSVEILSNFIENWKLLVTTKYKDNKLNQWYNSLNEWKIFDKKIVVLINWNSASASEITAWALKDYNKAILVWEKSYWKWSVQQPFDLKDGSMLKLTIAKWYTPNDINIDHEGIKPDIEVLFEKEDFEKKYDRQLEKAKEILKDFIKIENPNVVINEYNIKNWTWSTTWTWEIKNKK